MSCLGICTGHIVFTREMRTDRIVSSLYNLKDNYTRNGKIVEFYLMQFSVKCYNC